MSDQDIVILVLFLAVLFLYFYVMRLEKKIMIIIKENAKIIELEKGINKTNKVQLERLDKMMIHASNIVTESSKLNDQYKKVTDYNNKLIQCIDYIINGNLENKGE